MTCHTNPQVTPVLNSVHWVKANPDTPGAKQECESCHGASADHYRSMQAPAVVFGEGSERFPASEVAAQNQVCLSCHESGERIHWASSERQFGELTCVAVPRFTRREALLRRVWPTLSYVSVVIWENAPRSICAVIIR